MTDDDATIGSPAYLRAAAQLMIENPGKWYLVATGSVEDRHDMGTWAYRIRQGKSVPFRDVRREGRKRGRWEATVRTVPGHPPEESVRCYVRYAKRRSPEKKLSSP